jgi:hypothetical protein
VQQQGEADRLPRAQAGALQRAVQRFTYDKIINAEPLHWDPVSRLTLRQGMISSASLTDAEFLCCRAPDYAMESQPPVRSADGPDGPRLPQRVS